MAPREPFGMFYVAVDPSSKYEKLMGIITMGPYFLMCAMVVLTARCRELLTIVWLAGQLVNEVSNYVFKRLLKQPRPPGAPRVGMHESGMPSNHAQFMGFFVAYAVLVVVYRLRGYHPLEKSLALVGTASLGLLVCHSRLLFGFHTFEQVAVGFAIGLVSGCLWYALCSVAVFPYTRSITSTRLARLLLIRDASHVDNVIAFERAAYSGGWKES
uniref:Phosphatidic acid phosphatase type 2/haloperoxidase domain-containing protein n=1 Tax=Hemiselmis andersenii TaxID=464988 RepID=A0A7S1E1B7_HEMAN